MANKKFLRDNWFRHKRLGKKWRKPRGKQNKRRRHVGTRPAIPKVGYKSPKDERFLHPSGFEEVMVSNVKDLEGLDPENQAARVSGSVGLKKRAQILDAAEENDLKVLNLNEDKIESRKNEIERNRKRKKREEKKEAEQKEKAAEKKAKKDDSKKEKKNPEKEEKKEKE